MRWLFMSSVVLLASAAVQARAEQAECGLKEGDLADAFNVLDVTGPNKDKTLCYR